MSLIERDGIRLHFEEAGAGRPALLLVHGGNCDHTFFAPQLAHFSARHRVVAVDLRGYGASDEAGPYTIEAQADDLAWLVQELALERPVVVGHSMGGVIAVELAASHPNSVSAAVALDSMFFPRELVLQNGEVEALLDALRGDDYDAAIRAWGRSMHFGPHDDPVTAAEIVDVMARTPREVTVRAMESLLSWDGARALAACTVPVLAIRADADGPRDPSRLQREHPNLFVAQTVGSGHFIQLFVPEQVNAMIDRFLAIVRDGAGSAQG